MMADASLYQLLAALWLHEPDAATLARIAETPQAASLQTIADPAALAAAYADLFLLNVYPYGTAYTDAWGELNTDDAQRLADLYAQQGYQPRELNEVGAPDHLGLCLGFVAHPLPAGEGWGEGELALFFRTLLTWAPICCFAAERDPSAHPFYRALARLTRDVLLNEEWQAVRVASISPFAIRHSPFDDELRLRDVVHFLLAPARCGMFLSRARLGVMAQQLGMRLPFGARAEVCEWLFASAGEHERVSALLQALHAEADEWASAYRAWAAQYPAWQPIGAQWLARLAAARHLLRTMRAQSQQPLDRALS